MTRWLLVALLGCGAPPLSVAEVSAPDVVSDAGTESAATMPTVESGQDVADIVSGPPWWTGLVDDGGACALGTEAQFEAVSEATCDAGRAIICDQHNLTGATLAQFMEHGCSGSSNAGLSAFCCP
jgi:hypothetical protein